MATASSRCPRASRSSARSEGAPFAIFGNVDAQDVRHHVPPRSGAHAGWRQAAARISCTTSPASKATGRWRAYREQAVETIRKQVGKGKVICALSGGVDSSVAALLIHEAVGDQLTCILVDHGLMRKNEAAGRGRDVPRALQSPAGPCRRLRPLHRRAGRRGRSGEEAQDHRPAVHRSVRGRGEEARRRRFPGARHALSRRHRERLLHRRPVGDHQVAPQCRRPAGAHEHEAGRAAARAVQGRGEGARQGARPARAASSAAIRSRARASPSAARAASPAKSSRSCARPTRSISTRSARPASTTPSGRPSPCCCRCRRSA